jgi:Family of unknown function (DUF5317)
VKSPGKAIECDAETTINAFTTGGNVVLLVAMAALLATVPMAGGDVRRLRDLEFRWGGLVLLALVVEVLVLIVFVRADRWLLATGHFAMYVLAGFVVVANRRIGGVPLIGLGGLLNFIAISANGGVMPASSEAMARAGLSYGAADEFVNSRPLDDPQLQFLGDVFALPESWPISNVFSIGDVLIVVGIGVLLHTVSGSTLGRWTPVRARGS